MNLTFHNVSPPLTTDLYIVQKFTESLENQILKSLVGLVKFGKG